MHTLLRLPFILLELLLRRSVRRRPAAATTPAPTRPSSAPTRSMTRRSWRRRKPARAGPARAPRRAPGPGARPGHAARAGACHARRRGGRVLRPRGRCIGDVARPGAVGRLRRASRRGGHQARARGRRGDEGRRAALRAGPQGPRQRHPGRRRAAGHGLADSIPPASLPMKMGMTESAPPPTTGPPGAGARHEHVIELESSGRWKRKKSVDFLKFSPLGMELHHTGVLVMPLTMPLGAIALACTEAGPARPMAGEGRFPVLQPHQLQRRASRAIRASRAGCGPRAGGSAFPSLCDEDQAPNVAILFAHPLGEETITRRFAAGVRAGARRPLGARQPGRLRPADARPRRPAGGAHLHQVRRRQAAHRPRGRPDAAARAAHGCARRIRWSTVLGQLPRVTSVAPPGLA